MHLLLVADGRSPTTRRWVKTVLALGCRVTLVTTFPCKPIEGIEADVTLPVAFSSLAGSGESSGVEDMAKNGGTSGSSRSMARRAVSAFRPLFLTGRYQLGPLTLKYYGPRLRWLVEKIKPDLVHALRIPYEGMLASYTPPGIPLVVSTWGNDLTLHAAGSSSMAALTRKTLVRADGLMADTQRDVRLARSLGLADEKPTLVTPGNGGVDLDEIHAIRQRVLEHGSRFDSLVPPGAALVVNPRGFRTGSVRQDTFFQAIPLVYERRLGGKQSTTSGRTAPAFACAAMAGQRGALRWVERLKLQDKVNLLPLMPQADLWELLSRATLTLSISQHDGTPNSLLEAMALGVFPIAGDIESIREWITPGVNGLLVEPGSPQQLAEAILLALSQPDLRRRAADCNARIIAERAASGVVSQQIDAYYRKITGQLD